MRRFWLIFVLLSPFTVFAQESSLQSRESYVAPPPETVLLALASVPGCPLEFENAQLAIGIDTGTIAVIAQIRNRGTKAVRRFTPVIWTSFGTGGTLGGSEWSSGKTANSLIMPGQVVDQDPQIKLVPLTNELRDKLKLRGPLKSVVLLMIERVVFEDGSVYSAEPTSSAVRRYFEESAPK